MESLGINTSYLISQIINILILIIVLSKLVYKPVLNALEKRRKKIQEGLELTEKLNKEKEDLNVRREKVIQDAQKEARAIIEKAKQAGKKQEAEIVEKARKDAEGIIERGKKDLDVRKQEMDKQMKVQTIDIASALTEKLIGDVLDKDMQERLIKKKITSLLKSNKLS